MKRVLKIVVLLALVAMIAAPVSAQEKGKKKRKRQPRQHSPAAQVMAKLKKIDLTAEQKEKIKKIGETFKAKLEDLRAKVKLTPEQRKAGVEARKKAAAEGKKGKDARAAVAAAMKLTDEQAAAQKQLQETTSALRKEILGVLTPEQIEKAGLKVGRKGGKRKKRDK